jgi:hypothetical protein
MQKDGKIPRHYADQFQQGVCDGLFTQLLLGVFKVGLTYRAHPYVRG